jgi:hypothetical protein
VHTDPEHEQDDPDLSQLRGQLGIGHKAGCKRPLGDARQKITDEWWQAQPAGDVAANQSIDQADGDRRNQRDFMMHGNFNDRYYGQLPAKMASDDSISLTFLELAPEQSRHLKLKPKK